MLLESSTSNPGACLPGGIVALDFLQQSKKSVLPSLVIGAEDLDRARFWTHDVTYRLPIVNGIHFYTFLFLTLLACTFVYHQCLVHPLSSYPGPFLAKVTSYWRVYHFLQGSLHLVEHDLFDRYDSPVIRVGPSSLIFRSNDAFHTIYGFNKNLFRGDFYTMLRFVDKTENSIVSAETYELHQTKRKKLVSVAITPRAIATYEPIVTRCRDQWLAEIDNVLGPTNSTGLDINMLNQALSLDTLAEAVTGTNSNLLSMWQSDRFRDAIKHKKKTSRDAFAFGYVPWMPKFVTLLGFITKPYFRRERYDRDGKPLTRTMLYWTPLHHVEDEILPAAKRGQLSKPCILQSLVDVPSTDNRKMLTDQEIMAEITNLFFVGPGTTSAAVTSAIHDLALHQEWQDKISAEFATMPDDSADALANAPLFQAFLRESFRLRSHGPPGFPRAIRPGAENAIPGTHGPLPVGIEVSVPEYTVNRDPSVFGPDEDSFRPERWLVADDATLKRMQASWMVFGRGITACPGQRLVTMMVGKCAYGLLKRFKMYTTEQDLKGKCHFEMVYDTCRIKFVRRDAA